MADTAESTTDQADAEQQTSTDQHDDSSTTSDAEQGQPPKNLTELLATLPEDQQRIVKSELNAGRTENRKLRDRIKELTPKAEAHAQAQQAQQSAEETAAERERQATARAEAAVARMVASEVKALAAEKFADPEDAAAFLDASKFIDTDGEPDTEGIRDALDDLLSRKPHLGKPDPRPRPPAPNQAQAAPPAKPAHGERGIAEARRRFGGPQHATASAQ